MGIKGLSKLISDYAPSAVKEKEISHYFGRKIAIDASMAIYQFMIAIRTTGESAGQLMNDNGEVTSHLQGLFHRTIRMMSNGIKPVYVFDGKPPTMKSGELLKRFERRTEAEASLSTATQEANHADIDKFSRRTVKVTKENNEECIKLLSLMGVPIVRAPCEAEAQCAALAKEGVVFATATEDLDALTFGTPILLRYLTFSQARKMPVAEIHLDEVLKGLDITMEQFRELCILCGCDYTGSIRGIGPQKSLALIKEYSDIETALKHIDTKKYAVPDDFLYQESERLFISPEVLPAGSVKLEWKAPDEDGLIKFLVDEKQFDLDRVKSGLAKLKEAKKKSSQQRLESFFGAAVVTKRKAVSATKEKKPAKKRATKSKAK
uniref:Flap endonuclease 1 n=1 Tax=Spongospora subterranea TaxID=70186 RepID=A0A0H5R5L4_9EUKA|eukprot:CRZ09450.1 hypothetical protein [Spongospora subterranea]